MVEVFWDREQSNAHARFQFWRRRNPDGLFINCKTTKSGLIHRVECPHLGDSEWQQDIHSLTKLRKICSLNLRELKSWARENGFTKLSLCQDCRPDENPILVEMEADIVDKHGEFDPADVRDGRQKALGSIALRRGQPAFRKKLLNLYDGKCAISGCAIVDILDAAHIVPYKGEQTNHPQNGLLLRTDLHTLFDLGLIAVDSEKMTVITDEILTETEYSMFHGKKLRLPKSTTYFPSKAALDNHRARTNLE